jgi:gamma-glutamylcyclotransferase (GGCT)/AIG2-like uncharacterized protein YtfP
MNIFAYGTLVLPEVMRHAAGRTFRCERASLNGYARLRVRNESYPALLPFPDMHTDGVVYFDVDEESVRCLDRFEGSLYRREEVNVKTETGEWVEAETYVVRIEERNRLSAEPWDEDDFRKRHLHAFLREHPPVHR